MKAFLEEIKRDQGASFFIGIFQDHIEKSSWHYHSEYELSFITEGSGKRIVGDSTEAFYPGDLTFIGPRLPHVWLPSDAYGALHTGRTLESVYLLFNDKILPTALLNLPEFVNVRKALKLSERGMKIEGNALNKVSEIMLQLPYLDYLKKLLSFYEIMDILGSSPDYSPLVSQNYQAKQFKSSNRRVSQIHEFLMSSYHERITLEDIAELVNMAPGSVSRMFKMETGLSLFEYLIRIKIDLSIQLLLHTNLGIEEICYDSGFNNLSHFNRQFKKNTGQSPSEYRKFHQV